MIYALTPAFD